MMHTTRRALLYLAAAAPAAALWPVAARAAVTRKIEIRDFKFTPATLEVKVGDTVRWTNRDGAPHDATASDGSWKTKTLRTNRKGEITVTEGMGTDYFCSIHPQMKGSLVILGS